MSYSLEIVRRIYDDTEGVFIEVGPDADALNLIEIRTAGKENEEYYGKIRLLLHPDQARKLAIALTDAANDAQPLPKEP